MNSSLFEQENICYASTKFPPTRPFQLTAHEKLREGRKAGHKNQLIMAPTGSGKTYIGLKVAHEALLKNKTVIFVCDRTTLINQTSETADSYGLSAHGVIQSNHWRFDPKLPFQIASVQTLANRSWPDSDVVIIDECHSLYKTITDHIPTCRAAVIGLSATPFSDGLGKFYSNLINATNMHELTDSGVLVPMKVFSCTKANMEGAEISGGEWTDKAAQDRGMEIVGNVVEEWLKYGEDRKTIVFGATIAHCEEICRQFNEIGVMAAVFTSRTKEEERTELLKEYKKHNSILKILISVDALAKGFDVKDVSCVVDCRPLRKSLSTAIQMWGRGLRSSPDTGKVDCRLLDHSGNILRFMEDFTDIFYNGLETLDCGEKLDKAIRKDKPEDKEIIRCPECGYTPFAKRCIACGHEIQSISLIESEVGEMKEIMIGKRKMADDAKHLWEQCVTYAVGNSSPEKQKGRAAYIYKDITGEFPPSNFRFDATLNTPITKNVMGKIKQKNIAFARSNRK